jgi:hypothetical protein
MDSPIPVLGQWANKQGRPFGRHDLHVASSMTDVLGRIASDRTIHGAIELLQVRAAGGLGWPRSAVG